MCKVWTFKDSYRRYWRISARFLKEVKEDNRYEKDFFETEWEVDIKIMDFDPTEEDSCIWDDLIRTQYDETIKLFDILLAFSQYIQAGLLGCIQYAKEK